MRAGVFDLDNTLVMKERPEKVRGVRGLLNLTWSAKDFQAIILTARAEEVRQETEELLSGLGLKYDRLVMRSDSELDEPDHVFKRKKLEELKEDGLEIDFAVDDRGTVEKMLENQNIDCIKLPEKHRLRHLATDKLRILFPPLPHSLVKMYLGLYKRRF